MPKHKFQKIFDHIDKRFQQQKQEMLGPIFDHIDTKIDTKIDDLKEDLVTKRGFRGLQTTIDNLAKDVKDLRDEVHISNHRHDRAEDWIGQAAIKINLPFQA